ncbi:hypothetical protein [Actinomadura coerulea]|uniref:hypothetical protein n=1 Tax=Actinomadura coerulea TaxID=46159 RepID=UPI00341547D6
MKSFSYTELDKLAGEVLPERAVLSTLLVGGGENENGNLNLNHGGGDGSTIAQNACKSYTGGQEGDHGLLSALGLGRESSIHSEFTCLPGQVVSGH